MAIIVTPSPASVTAQRGGLFVTPWFYEPGWFVDECVPTVVIVLAPTPTPAIAIQGAIAPTIVLGSLTLTPTWAVTVSEALAPTVVLGSLTLTPTLASVVTTALPPAVIQGSLLLSPALALAYAAALAPVIIQGSLILSPALASVISGAITPAVILGSLTLTPILSPAYGTAPNPTVVLSSQPVLVEPAPATVKTTELDWFVSGWFVAGWFAEGMPNPLVIYGSTMATPGPASVISLAVSPYSQSGGIGFMPARAIAKAGVGQPYIMGGETPIIPVAAGAVSSALKPGIAFSATTISPPGATAYAGAFGPVLTYMEPPSVAPDWPDDFPLPRVANYLEYAPDIVARYPMDTGPPKLRRRFSSNVAPIVAAYILTLEQWVQLTYLYWQVWQGGNAFQWRHPRKGYLACRFTEPPVAALIGPELYAVQCRFELMPED